MKPQSTADYNSISWVKKQLDEVLAEAQRALSDYIENSNEDSYLQKCIDNLRLVSGTLQIVEVYGAAMLAEEMEQTARAQLEGRVDKPEDVYDVLMRAMLQLPDYLEGLQSGNRDTPLALLPLMNDLRAARKEKLLSENVLFLPDVESVVIETDEIPDTAIESGDLQKEARRLRTHYQLGLLDFLKNNKESAGLQRMSAVISALEKVTSDASVRRFWMVISGLLEALTEQGIDSNISVKMLLGSVDRQIKVLIDAGENDFADSYSQDLLKNLLYYIARSTSTGVRVSRISAAYRLAELLPSESDSSGYGASMGGLNAELFNTVSQGINEDLSQVKDTLEIFAHSGDRNVEQLRPLIEQLSKIADTYGMLGVGSARQRVMDQRAIITKIVSGEIESSEDQVMSVASELLVAESELNNFIAQRSGAVVASMSDAGSPVATAEFRQVLSAVIKEGLNNFTEAKEAILAYVSGVGQDGQLEIIMQRLEEVRGITMMMPMEQTQSQIEKLMTYIRVALQHNHHVPDADEQDTVADVVTAIEYYLEAVAEGRPGIEVGMRAGDVAADKLIVIADTYPEISAAAVVETETQAEVAPSPAKVKITPPPVKAVIAEAAIRTDYSIIGEDADQEIVEIFIEEALEVLENLNTYFPAWRENQDDDEALTIVRRSFHTLKGSGRLIGADLIGEFSWKVENMLNRVINNRIQPGPLMYQKMNEALAVLPQLIEQINGNREPVDNVLELMAAFDAISEGRDPNEAVAAAPTVLPDEDDDAVATEAVATEVDATEEIELSAAPDDSFETSLDELSAIELEPVEEEADAELETIDLSFDSSAAPDIDTGEEEVLELSFEKSSEDTLEIDLNDLDNLVDTSADTDDGIELFDIVEISGVGDDLEIEFDEFDNQAAVEQGTSRAQMDPLLFKIYYDESQSHLAMVEAMLEAHRSKAEPLEANKDMIRAFHTLYGSARTAEVESIAELCGATEKFLRAKEEALDLSIQEDAIEVITEVKETVKQKLEELKDGGMPSSSKKLLETITRLVQKELQDQLQESARAGDDDDFMADDEILTSLSQTTARAAPATGDKPAEPARTKATRVVEYSDIDDELIDIFLEEAEEILESCETGVMAIIDNHGDIEQAQNLQRHMHTLKGGARMAELTPVGDLTHNLETLLIMLTEGKIKPEKIVFDTLHESLDMLTSMLSNVKHRQPIVIADDLNYQIETIMRGDVPEKRTVERFDVELDQLTDDPVVALKIPGDVTPPLERRQRASDKKKDPSWGERASDVNTRDNQELVRVRADLLNDLVNYAGEVNIYHARMGKQMSDVGFNLAELEQTVERLKDQLRNLEIETEIQIRSNYKKESDQYGKDFDPLEMDRYSTLQQLSRSLSETAGDVESINGILADIVRDSETLLLQESRVSTELQEGLMRTRMVRFGGLGTRLRRIVRQTAKELGKDVELEIKGDTSEVDRTVLDRIVAPLEHMLRNGVAHGIEKPGDRAFLGKPETGTITISVYRHAADVIIHVQDDGSGIDTKAIRKKAIERGLMKADSPMSDRDVLQFILKAGFSTAAAITQVAGRGVGMDVVDSEIKQLGGSLEIDTTPGKGTLFKIRLPLTLAINQALLVNAADDIYAVPLASIEGVVRITGPELQGFYDSGQTHYHFNAVEYELKHLGKLLTGVQGNYSEQHRLFPVLLAKVGEHHYALHVDDLVGRREIVVKPVGLQIGLVRGIAGATILADGRVVLILEMSALVVGESLFKQVIEEEVVAPAKVVETTVMVVDDSITIRKVTERILLRNGMKVLLAKDGVDATNILQDHKPDLMLLDIEMPRMDGFELATYIRNDERLKDLPIIMITSRTGAKHKQKAMDIGVNQYLGKPYQEEELMQNINSLLAEVR